MKLFVDGSNLAHICFWGVSQRGIIDEEEFKNAFLGLYRKMLNKIENTFPFYEILFAWEGENSLKNRLELYPEYKQQRLQKSPLVFSGRTVIQEYHKQINMKDFRVPFLEADDVIYALSHIYQDTKDKNVILSSDQDFLQIVQEGLVKGVYSYKDKKYLKVPEYDIVSYKCIVGDSSDNIKGISGIGEKRFKKMYEENLFTEKEKNIIENLRDVISLKNYSIKYNTLEKIRELI